MIYPFEGTYPDIHPSVFMSEDVVVIGDVHIAEDVSLWFGTVIRGDVHQVRIGARTNIQDNCSLHETWQKYPLMIGADVTVGHAAVLHACTIHDACLIGMGAKVLDNATVHSESLIAAGAVVREGFEVPPGTLAAGVPAKIVRDLTEEERAYIRHSARQYMRYVESYRRHRDLDRGLDFHSYLEYRRTGRL
ncbi:MAG: gamma carbonic anhydrase family protein [Bacteroidetes bacterium]|nr:gamma carbonic anhydrase family protein [Bacteroidota bacterium]